MNAETVTDSLATVVAEVAEIVNTNPYKEVLMGKNISFSFSSIFMAVLGVMAIIAIAWLFSTDRKGVDWKLVSKGLLIQFMIAVAVLQIIPMSWMMPVLLAVSALVVIVLGLQLFKKRDALTWKLAGGLLLSGALIVAGVLVFFYASEVFVFLGKCFVAVLSWTKSGSEFLFGSLLNMNHFGFIFAFQILPTIIFFSALTSLFFYLGIIQKVVWAMAWLLTKAMHLSGAESLSVSGNIFLGQTEAPLMVKEYIPSMTRSEVMLVMTAGMATMAGGVLAAYIGMLGAGDKVMELEFAKHLLSASVMAAPGAVVIAKILVPQREEIDNTIEISKEKIGKNVLDSISNGATEGLKLAGNVAAMLLVFYALIAGFNFIIGKVGVYTHLNGLIAEATNGQFQGLSLQFLLGYIFAPVIWIMGVPWTDVPLVGQLLGEKLIMTEFVGYQSLATMVQTGMFSSPRAIIMSVYILCGFANFASVGIQIGGIGGMAPNKKTLLSEFGMRALLGGTLAAMMSATMVGMFLG